jgi:hypothetical protein
MLTGRRSAAVLLLEWHGMAYRLVCDEHAAGEDVAGQPFHKAHQASGARSHCTSFGVCRSFALDPGKALTAPKGTARLGTSKLCARFRRRML